jgi:hypothetical protein
MTQKFILNSEPFIKLSSIEKQMFSMHSDMEKQAIITSFLRKAFPWVAKAMAASRGSGVVNLGTKAGRQVSRAKTPFWQAPGQRIVGGVLNPIQNVEVWSKLIHKNPRKYMPMAWKQFTQRAWSPLAPGGKQLRQYIGLPRKTRPWGLFLSRTPTVPGGNIYKRTRLGTTAHAAIGTGLGLGALDTALTGGGVGKRLKAGAKTSVWWGPLRPVAATKAFGYDIPKMFLAKPKTPRLPNQQATYYQNQNINYPY